MDRLVDDADGVDAARLGATVDATSIEPHGDTGLPGRAERQQAS